MSNIDHIRNGLILMMGWGRLWKDQKQNPHSHLLSWRILRAGAKDRNIITYE